MPKVESARVSVLPLLIDPDSPLPPEHSTANFSNSSNELAHPAWRHPAELEFIEPANFGKEQLISFLCANGFSIPERCNGAAPACINLLSTNGTVTSLPWRYRVPLMFVAKFQWQSLREVMISPTENQDVEDCKFDILHVCRLSTRLLEEARAKAKTGSMDRAWRCATFDRALVRYYRRWLVSREEFVREFWMEFREEEFENDIEIVS